MFCSTAVYSYSCVTCVVSMHLSVSFVIQSGRMKKKHIVHSRCVSFGIEVRLRVRPQRNVYSIPHRDRNKRLCVLRNVETYSGTYPASYSVGTESLFQEAGDWGSKPKRRIKIEWSCNFIAPIWPWRVQVQHCFTRFYFTFSSIGVFLPARSSDTLRMRYLVTVSYIVWAYTD